MFQVAFAKLKKKHTFIVSLLTWIIENDKYAYVDFLHVSQFNIL